MSVPEENKEQWQRVADAENPGMETMSGFYDLARERDTWRDNYQALLDDAVEQRKAYAELRSKLFLAKIEHDSRKFERDQFGGQLQQLAADFDRRTDILNNHIAREKVLEARVAELMVDTGMLKSENSKLHEELGQAYGLVNQAGTRVKTLEDALKFYVEPSNWGYFPLEGSAHNDVLQIGDGEGSEIAKQALAAKEPK